MQQLWLLPVFVLCILCTDNKKRQLLSDVTNTDITASKSERRVLVSKEEIQKVLDGCESQPNLLDNISQSELLFDEEEHKEFVCQLQNQPSLLKDNFYYLSVDAFDKQTYAEERVVKEMLLAQQLSKIPNINVPNFQKCYKEVDLSYLGKSTVILYGDIKDSLATRDRKYNNIIKFQKIKNYFYLSKQQRINNILQLFQTLVAIHKENIALRNISPVNIKLNVRLEDFQGDSDESNNVKLYFSNFQYAYSPQVQSVQMQIFEDTYVHPETKLWQKNEMDPKNDVYALCVIYFLIEIYNPDYLISRIQNDYSYKPQVIGDENVKPDDQFGNKLGLPELQEKLNDAINAQRRRIKEDVPNILPLDYDQREKVEEYFLQVNDSSDLESTINGLLEVCQNICECIIYSGIQYSLYHTPSAQLIATALQKCIEQNNKSNNILI